MIIPVLLLSLLLGPSVTLAGAICDGEKLLARVHGEPYAAAKKLTTDEWIHKNTRVVTSKKDLEDFAWGIKRPEKFIDELFYSVTYKFSVTKNCEMKISTMPWDIGMRNPPTDMNHMILAGADEVYTAGSLVLLKDREGRPAFLLTNRSTRFCPPLQSLQIAARLLEKAGWKKDSDFTISESSLKDCVGKR